MTATEVGLLTGEPCGTWRRLENKDAWVCEHDYFIAGVDLADLASRRHD